MEIPSFSSGTASRFCDEDKAKVKTATAFFRDRLVAHGFDNREPWNSQVIAKYTAQHLLGCNRKGLAIFGAPGRGKTAAMRVFGKMRGVRMAGARDIVEEFRKHTDNRNDFWAWIRNQYITGHDPFWRDLIIDDIGTEPTLNEYGTKQEVIDSVINNRYEALMNDEALTLMTFNLPMEPVSNAAPADSIRGRYGERFLSRVHEMCHVVHFRGPDWRQTPTEEGQ